MVDDTKYSTTQGGDQATEATDAELRQLLAHDGWKYNRDGNARYFATSFGAKFTLRSEMVPLGKGGDKGKAWKLFQTLAGEGERARLIRDYGVNTFDGLKDFLACGETRELLEQLFAQAKQLASEDAAIAQSGKDPEGCIVIEEDNFRKMAKLFAEEFYGMPLIYYRGFYHHWTGTHYAKAEDDTVRSRVSDFLSRCHTEKKAMDAEGAVTRVKQAFSPNIQREREVLNALKNLILVDATLEAPAWLRGADEEQRKHDPSHLFSFPNGLLDLHTEELLPDSRSFLSFNPVDYNHDPEAECPDWEKFVHEVLDEEDMRITLQQMFGYLISNDTRHQKIFANLGRRRSGKGTTTFVLEHLLGRDNVTNPDLENIQQHFGMESLIGKRLAVIGDARLPRGGDTSRLSGRLLMLSGGDAIGIPRKGIADWNGRLNIRVVINANLPPSFADDSGVIADRFIILRFRQSFVGREDHGLRDRLVQELPGIFNWALRGLKSLREAGRFTQPASSEEMIAMMRNATNPIFPFMEDNIVLDRNSEVSRDEVGARYRKWAEDNGHRPMSLTKLALQLNSASEGEVTEARVGTRSSRERVFRGCRLIEEAGFGAGVVSLAETRGRRLGNLGAA